MPYSKRLLNDYETVAVDLHPHWWFFARPVTALVASIILAILTLIFVDSDGTESTPFRWLVLLMIVGSAIWLVVREIRKSGRTEKKDSC